MDFNYICKNLFIETPRLVFDWIRGKSCVCSIKYPLLLFLPLNFVRYYLLYPTISKNILGREFWGKKFNLSKMNQHKVIIQIFYDHRENLFICGDFCYSHQSFPLFPFSNCPLSLYLTVFCTSYLQEYMWHRKKSKENNFVPGLSFQNPRPFGGWKASQKTQVILENMSCAGQGFITVCYFYLEARM